jgi:histidinol phosphatase-like PHP family hydrolase
LKDFDDQPSELEESCDLVRLKVHHLNEIFKKKITKVSITSMKTENVKYLTFRVFQKNSPFFKIIQNPTYSGHFFF